MSTTPNNVTTTTPTSTKTTPNGNDEENQVTEAKAREEITHIERRGIVRPTEDIFDPLDPHIKQDIVRLISQYLHDEGYHQACQTLQSEAELKQIEWKEEKADIQQLKKSISMGDWEAVNNIISSRPLVRNQKAFLYAVYKQQYLELIEKHSTQEAFQFLTKYIKPLERYQTKPDEFKDFCYLLTARSVTDVSGFKDWEGIIPSREKLVNHIQSMLEFERLVRDPGSIKEMLIKVDSAVPQQRLLELLRQAVAYQIQSSRYFPLRRVNIPTLLKDYESFVIPNAPMRVFKGHTGNVKCLTFAGLPNEVKLVTGSSDNTVRLFDLSSGRLDHVFEGHTSRIWSISSDSHGKHVVSASGDKTVKLWDVESKRNLSTLTGHEGDVYAVRYHPNMNQVISGGYDKCVRIFDLNTGQVIKAFSGHKLAVTGIAFNPVGNLIVTGSKDHTIRFWDANSGICVRNVSAHLGEITSVELNESGDLLLSCCKDNANRLIDIRTTRLLRKLKGHQHTSKNFVRASFAHNSVIVGGSEDGMVYLWDQETGEVLKTLFGHTGTVYDARWSKHQSILCSCSDDNTAISWWFDENISTSSLSLLEESPLEAS